MGKFDGILICTDLDGTLLRNDKTISPENKAAAEYFKSEGGTFTFVTGRMPFCLGGLYREIMPNAPFGCMNGGGLYDYENQRYMWTSEMDKNVTELIKYVDETFPEIGICVSTYYKCYFSRENGIMEWFREVSGIPNLVRNYTAVDETTAKIIFGGETDEEIEALANGLKSHPSADKFDFVRSERNLYEILPKGTGKGMAVIKLSECLGIDIDKTVAVGDYDNDVSMLKAAKIGIAVSNASTAALDAADYVAVSNEENAIADVIYGLESGKYRFDGIE